MVVVIVSDAQSTCALLRDAHRHERGREPNARARVAAVTMAIGNSP